MKVVLGKLPRLNNSVYLTLRGKRPPLILPKQLIQLLSNALILDRVIWFSQANDILSYYDLLPSLVNFEQLEAYVYSLESLFKLMRYYFSSKPLTFKRLPLFLKMRLNLPHTSLLTLLNPQFEEFKVEHFVIDMRKCRVDDNFLKAIIELLERHSEVYLVKDRVDGINYETVVPADYPRLLLSRVLDPRARDKVMRSKSMLIKPGIYYTVEDCNVDFLNDNEIEDVRVRESVEELDYLKIVFNEHASSVYAVLDELVELGSLTYRNFSDSLTNQFRKDTARWVFSLLVRVGFIQLIRTSGGLEVYPTERAYRVVLHEARHKEVNEVS